ncbi:restriction endonuclease subunit S [Pyrococcus kukulkanii]|uniref:restriction endonuclease subunit S n=1 Tax=Pyrococcus kukulkanii TaxID=1609559 RepID=UPI0035637207
MRERPLTEFISKKGTQEKKKSEKPKGLKGPWELPEGWRWVKLEDVVKELKPGFARNKKHISDDGIPHLRPNNIGLGRLNLESIVKVKIEYGFNIQDYYLKKGDILFNNTNSIELVGRAALVSENLGFGYSNHITRIRVKENLILPEWLVFVINYLWMQGYFRRVCTHWIGQAGVNINTLKKIPIPLPPLSEQKRIVAKLDELNKRIEEAKRLAREAREEAEKLMASALHEVFSKAEEKGWEWVRLEKIVGIRGNAGVKRKLSQSDSIAFIPMELIPERGVFARYELREPANIKSYSYSEPGDILLAKITPSFENGKQGIVPDNIPNGFALATTEVYPIYIKDTSSLDRMYLFYILKSEYVRKTLEAQMLGTTGRQRVPKEAILRLKIPLPPLEEQKHVVTYLNSIHERVQRLIKLYEEREKELEQLLPSILDKAFKGEL